MILLSGVEIARVRHLFKAARLGFVLDGMIAGNTPSRAWTDDLDMPRTALVWDCGHNLYLAGSVDRPEVWRELFDHQVGPAAPDFLKAHIPSVAVGTVVTGYRLERRNRALYRRAPTVSLSLPARLPAGFRISSINDRFHDLGALGNFAEVIEEIESCWTSVGDFRRAGFGFVAHDSQQIVCWCTAECVSDRRCGIGIETVSAYQRQGLRH